jgi:hypothetical protein
VHERVRSVFPAVRVDVRSTTAIDLRLEDDDWGSIPDQQTARLWAADRPVVGVYVLLSDSAIEQQVSMADQVQDWLVENIGGTATNWPVCPEHPTTHPLTARAVADTPSWVCPVTGTVVAAIGALGRA